MCNLGFDRFVLVLVLRVYSKKLWYNQGEVRSIVKHRVHDALDQGVGPEDSEKRQHALFLEDM